MKMYVLGAGNWGTTLGRLFSRKHDVTLWTSSDERTAELQELRNRRGVFHGGTLPENIRIETRLSTIPGDDELVILAVPSRRTEEVIRELAKSAGADFMLLNVSKGVKPGSLETISGMVESFLPGKRVAALSGPTIAMEVQKGIPARCVLASKSVEMLLLLQKELSNDVLAFEFSRDIAGVELCGALKGLVAICVGIADGLGLGDNIFGAVMTCGLREFQTLMRFLGVSTKTVYGLAGIGDLITTCMSPHSRNRRFGRFLAEGLSTEIALKKVGMEVEGVSMASTIRELTRFNLSLPLFTFVARAIFESGYNLKTAILQMLDLSGQGS